ncbi:MAG: hypothetical protein PHI64_12830 [Zoogloea sp.]|uniref:hypothetical protein n=1 Tax=Zoogloea sp. TaxID=49181 RepID=UPI00261A30FB|nr:hypothetical protein [Zoogloea sp.]MDD2989833.1 hypothetical protein [Zoogloea sp.]
MSYESPLAVQTDTLDDEHPLWLVNEQIKGLLEGEGASEDHEDVRTFLLNTGLPEGTVNRIHKAIVWGDTKTRPSQHPVNVQLLRALKRFADYPGAICEADYSGARAAIAEAEAPQAETDLGYPVRIKILVTQPHGAGTYWSARRISEVDDVAATGATPREAICRVLPQAAEPVVEAVCPACSCKTACEHRMEGLVYCASCGQVFAPDSEASGEDNDRINGEDNIHRAAQAVGMHPAPCARHCEATAFEIEIRRLTAERDVLAAKLADAAQVSARLGEAVTGVIAAEQECKSPSAWVQKSLTHAQHAMRARAWQELHAAMAAANPSLVKIKDAEKGT